MFARTKKRLGIEAVLLGIAAGSWLLLDAAGADPGGSGSYILECATISSGGGSLTDSGGADRGLGVVGQAVAGVMTGPGYTLEVGLVPCLGQESPSVPSDLDGDGDVDVIDFLTFSGCFNGSLNPPKAACLNFDADVDGDGDVDVIDFLTFATCFNGSLNPPACP